MPYEVNIRCELDHLYVQASGFFSTENLISMVRDCIKANEEYDYKKLLFDIRCMNRKLSTFECYDLCKELPKKVEGFRPNRKTAVVDLEENRDQFRFVETVLVNMGFNFRFFTNTVEAERWLYESK
jgi:hypothetical protein